MGAVALVFIRRLCLIRNRISKSELIQKVPIPKKQDFSETIMVSACAPL